jgi:dTMP kinase
VFITFEGVEGSGKSTQLARLARWLKQTGRPVEQTSEPDGTALGLAIRRLFERDLALDPTSEMLLFMAARRQHVTEKIDPWLSRGRIVLCDRFIDATVAYQGYGRKLDPNVIREMNVRVTGGTLPDLTLLFDLNPEIGFKRIGRRRLDQFEKLEMSFHRRVRRGYLEIQRAEPKRVWLVRAARSEDAVAAEVRTIVEDFLHVR